MTDRPYFFAFNVNDFCNDPCVSAMTATGRGVYIMLLCCSWNWHEPGYIPDCDQILARWGRVSLKTWERLKTEVLAAFKEDADGRLYQKRLRDEWKKSTAMMARKSEAAKRGAESRWSSRSDRRTANASEPHPSAMPAAGQPDSNPMRGESGCHAQPQPQPQPQPDTTPTTTGGGGGASAKPRERQRSSPSLRNVTVEELRDTARLLRRIEAMVRDGTLENTETEALKALAASERAIEVGDDPAALFVRIVTERNWKLLTAGQCDRARERLRVYRRTLPAEPMDQAVRLAARLGAGVPSLPEGGDA